MSRTVLSNGMTRTDSGPASCSLPISFLEPQTSANSGELSMSRTIRPNANALSPDPQRGNFLESSRIALNQRLPIGIRQQGKCRCRLILPAKQSLRHGHPLLVMQVIGRYGEPVGREDESLDVEQALQGIKELHARAYSLIISCIVPLQFGWNRGGRRQGRRSQISNDVLTDEFCNLVQCPAISRIDHDGIAATVVREISHVGQSTH